MTYYYQIEADYLKNKKIGDIIEINGNVLSGHGIRFMKLFEKHLKSIDFKCLNDFISIGKPLTINELSKLVNKLDINSYRIPIILKELILEQIRLEIDTTLPSRFKSIYLSEEKFLSKWAEKNGDGKPVYKFEVIEIRKIHKGDEYVHNIYSDASEASKHYWSTLEVIGVNHLIEVVFQGKLVVVDKFENLKHFKTQKVNY